VLGPFFDRHNLDVGFKAMKIPLYLCLNVFRKVFFPLFSIVQHFVLKAEWFDVQDCATITVVYDGSIGKWSLRKYLV